MSDTTISEIANGFIVRSYLKFEWKSTYFPTHELAVVHLAAVSAPKQLLAADKDSAIDGECEE
jgi:hypothetical protein